jgi:hypothetical protein
MSYEADLRVEGEQLERELVEIFTEVCQEVERSVVFGSEITGAKGQPFRTIGGLRDSFVAERPSAFEFELSSDKHYGPYIEEGGNSRGRFNPERQDGKNGRRSAVGGYHNVELTLAAVDRILAIAQHRVWASAAWGDASFGILPRTR